MVTPNLPWELESEILSRVPPTSVKQLRLTCKRWYALFKDPIFTKNHLGKAAKQIIFKHDESVYSFSFNFHGIHNPVIEFTGKLKSLKDSEDVTIYKIFHCDGLLLCTTKGNRLAVWNPCTGQTRWIQSRVSRPSSSDYNTYYLGYVNNNKSCDSYKILSCSYNYRGNIRVRKYEIYEFNSDLWRVLEVISDDWLYLWYDVAVSLKGDAYWLDSDLRIDRFDFTTEKFKRLHPPSSGDEHTDLAILSTVREEKLALLCQYSDSTGSLKMKIWVTDPKTDEAKDLSWSQFLVVVDLGRIMIYGMPKVESFLVDEETKKVLCCDTDHHDEHRTIIYIVGEDTFEIIYREVPKGSQLRASPRLFSYVPSLVQIPGKAE